MAATTNAALAGLPERDATGETAVIDAEIRRPWAVPPGFLAHVATVLRPPRAAARCTIGAPSPREGRARPGGT